MKVVGSVYVVSSSRLGKNPHSPNIHVNLGAFRSYPNDDEISDVLDKYVSDSLPGNITHEKYLATRELYSVPVVNAIPLYE